MTKRSSSRLALHVVTAAFVLAAGLPPPPALATPFFKGGEQLICAISSPAFPQAPKQTLRQAPKAAGLLMPSACEWFCTPCEYCSSDCLDYGCGTWGSCERDSSECGSFNGKCNCRGVPIPP